MTVTTKEIESRKETIEKDLEELFQKHMKITDWDVPEADDQQAARMIVKILQHKLDAIEKDVEDGKYEFY